MLTGTEKQNSNFSLLLQQARAEAQADAATIFSSHLDKLIQHIVTQELGRVEIVELLSQNQRYFITQVSPEGRLFNVCAEIYDSQWLVKSCRSQKW